MIDFDGLRAVDDVARGLPSLGGLDLPILGGAQLARAPGYSLGDPELTGRALLAGGLVDLVYRLKDTRPLLATEIDFWGAQLARLAPAGVDFVTHAPSSGKVAAAEHLATLLARSCAAALGLEMRGVFINQRPRQNRGGRVAHLREARDNPYGYAGPGDGSLILCVDDVVFTRSTARRCAAAAAAAGDRLTFAVLYRA
jgi:hypothetical protein